MLRLVPPSLHLTLYNIPVIVPLLTKLLSCPYIKVVSVFVFNRDNSVIESFYTCPLLFPLDYVANFPRNEVVVS